MSKNRKPQRNDTSAKAKFNAKPRKSKKGEGIGTYLGIEHDSYEELSFLFWVEEVKRQGYITAIRRSESFLLCDGITNHYAEQLKTKSKPMTQLLAHGHSYTPEFVITWDIKKARDKFVWILGSECKHDKLFVAHRVPDDPTICKTYIEVKPSFDFGNMTRLATINIKWVYQKYSIFINMVKPKELFAKTFAPNKFLITSTGKARKLDYKPRTLYEYLNKR